MPRGSRAASRFFAEIRPTRASRCSTSPAWPGVAGIGVTVSVRTVDDVQYQNRLRNFDFDLTTVLWGQSISPGNEQRDYFGSAAADRHGSTNYPGIKKPAVDHRI